MTRITKYLKQPELTESKFEGKFAVLKKFIQVVVALKNYFYANKYAELIHNPINNEVGYVVDD